MVTSTKVRKKRIWAGKQRSPPLGWTSFYFLRSLLRHCNIDMHSVFIMPPDETGKFQQLSGCRIGERELHGCRLADAQLFLWDHYQGASERGIQAARYGNGGIDIEVMSVTAGVSDDEGIGNAD